MRDRNAAENQGSIRSKLMDVISNANTVHDRRVGRRLRRGPGAVHPRPKQGARWKEDPRLVLRPQARSREPARVLCWSGIAQRPVLQYLLDGDLAVRGHHRPDIG